MIALADCNNFFCSCERVFQPQLRNTPVVVLSNNDGCVIARSNESKALGIKMGQPFYQVKNLLEKEGVAVFSSNYTLYGDMSSRVMSLLSTYSPKIDIYSIDEAFLDFSGIAQGEELRLYSEKMVREVAKGTGIPISLGVAQTKTLAKVASKFAKKHKGYNGVCIIDTEEKSEKALKLLDISDVWGIGRSASKTLNYYGIKTAWDFTLKSQSWVRNLLTITGERIWREVRGESCIETEELPHKKSICTSRSFPDSGLSKLSDVEEAVANFAAQCSRKLREQRAVCQSVTIFAYTSRFRTDILQNTIHQTITLPVATSSTQELVSLSVQTIRNSWKRGEYLYKKAGVIVWNIQPDNAVQGSLFDTVDRAKHNALSKAIDEINKKNGFNTIRIAVQGYNKAWHLKCEHISKQYTTNINDVIEVVAK